VSPAKYRKKDTKNEGFVCLRNKTQFFGMLKRRPFFHAFAPFEAHYFSIFMSSDVIAS